MAQETVSTTKVKFATQLAPDVLETLRSISAQEGRHIQTILDEALREYIANRGKPRSHVLHALRDSMAEYDSLYEALSK